MSTLLVIAALLALGVAALVIARTGGQGRSTERMVMPLHGTPVDDDEEEIEVPGVRPD